MADLFPFDSVLELFEIWRALESHAAAGAAAKCTPELMAELDDLLARMEATDNSADNSELDARFHEAICSAGGNSTLTGLMSLFRSRGRHFNVFDSIEGATAGHIAQTEFWLRKLRPEPNVDH